MGPLKLKAESSELLALDSARFVAAAGIVVHHALGFTTFGAVESLRLLVDFFFTISGFVIAFVYGSRLQSVGQYSKFLSRRIARLGPLHWGVLACFVFLGLVTQKLGVVVSGGVFEWQCLIPNAALLHATGLCGSPSFNGPSWSISAEMILYLAAPAILILSRRRLLAGLTVVVSIAVLMAFSRSGRNWTEWTWDGGVLRAFPSFLFGALLYHLRSPLKRLPHGQWLSGASLGFFFAGAVAGLAPLALLGLLYLAMIGLVASDVRNESANLAKIAPLGQLTYSSYMLHSLILSVLASHAVISATHMPKNLMVVLAFLIVWPASYLSLIYFETPARKVLSKILGGRRYQPEGMALPAP